MVEVGAAHALDQGVQVRLGLRPFRHQLGPRQLYLLVLLHRYIPNEGAQIAYGEDGSIQGLRQTS